MSVNVSSSIENMATKAEGKGEASSTTSSSSGKKAIRYPFWFGGSSACCGAIVTHPLDLGECFFFFFFFLKDEFNCY